MAAQAGLCLTWSQTAKTAFLVTWLIYILYHQSNISYYFNFTFACFLDKVLEQPRGGFRRYVTVLNMLNKTKLTRNPGVCVCVWGGGWYLYMKVVYMCRPEFEKGGEA